MKKFRVSGFGFAKRRSLHSTRNSQLSAGARTLAALLIAWPLGGGAQVLNDPTRPPAAVFSSAPGDTGAVAVPLLQSVMISPAGSSAIISGEMVKLGGAFGNAKLIKISESEVVLKSGEETQVLKMYPGVERHERTKTAPKAASRRTQAPRQKPADIGPGVAR